jgi:hypothetical protein
MRRVLALAVVTLALACGGGGSSKWPARAEGCQVLVFREKPTMKSENIGGVRVRCDDFVARDACLRTMLDEVCKLGGDVVWGVDPEPEHIDDKVFWRGRAAHSL